MRPETSVRSVRVGGFGLLFRRRIGLGLALFVPRSLLELLDRLAQTAREGRQFRAAEKQQQNRKDQDELLASEEGGKNGLGHTPNVARPLRVARGKGGAAGLAKAGNEEIRAESGAGVVAGSLTPGFGGCLTNRPQRGRLHRTPTIPKTGLSEAGYTGRRHRRDAYGAGAPGRAVAATFIRFWALSICSASKKPCSWRMRVGWRILRSALASIWRMRSRVTLNCLPTSSSVRL